MLEAIQREILLKLMKSSDYVSSKDLAFTLNTSEKTILKHLNILKSDLKENGASLEVKHGHGSYLAITDQEAFRAYLGEDTPEEVPVTKEGRRAYVLSRLINTEDYVNIYDLADELYISPSLLRLIIKGLVDVIESYHLKLDHSHSHGYRITGAEKDIRRCITKECREVKQYGNYTMFSNLKGDLTTRISSIVARTLEKYNIAISEDGINSLTLHILIAINRFETMNQIEVDEIILQKLQSSPEYYVMKNISKEMKEQLGIELPDIELAYLTLHLNGKQRLFAHEHLQVQITDDALVFYNRMLRNIYQIARVSFFEDEELRVSLLNHIVPFINRLNNDMQISKSSLEGIKLQFPYAYDLAVIGLSFLNDGFSVTSAETGYFALHLALSLEKARGNVEAGSIAVICDEVSSLYNMMSFKINRSLSDLISTIQFLSVSEAQKMGEELPESYELVLNTSKEQFPFDEKLLNVSTFITDAEMEMIRGRLKKAEQYEDNYELFRDDLFFRIHENMSKDKIIHMMASRAKELYGLSDSFYDSILERERLEPTEYANRIAIPHPLKNEEGSELIAVALLDRPVLWNTQKVQLIFLISLSNHKKTEWFMDKISTLLVNDEMSQTLILSSGFEEFIRNFKSVA